MIARRAVEPSASICCVVGVKAGTGSRKLRIDLRMHERQGCDRRRLRIETQPTVKPQARTAPTTQTRRRR